ncbi:class I adenylate-forming enzyme family protein [Streptomyces sp. NPDC002623]
MFIRCVRNERHRSRQARIERVAQRSVDVCIRGADVKRKREVKRVELYLDTFEAGVRKFGERPLIVSGDESWTYAQVDELASRIAQGLMAAGVAPGSHVGVYSPNHVYGFACQWGLLRAGCLWVPLNYRMGGAAMAEAVDSLDVDWLFYHSSLEADLDAIEAKSVGTVCLDRPGPAAPSLDQWLPSELDPAVTYPARTSSDPAALLLTSGTTGTPKGIVVSNRAWVSAQQGFDEWVSYDVPPRHLVVAPITHAAGMYAAMLHPHGGTHILMNSTRPGDILEAIEKHGATTLFVPPTLVYMMMADPKVKSYDYRTLRTIVYGTAPMAPAKAREAWEVFGPVLMQGYGQSEALMVIAVMDTESHREAIEDPAHAKRLESVGRPTPGFSVEIMSEAGELLPQGERGEIVVRGDLVMDGYYKNPEATAEAQQFGWHHTGDIGVIDEDGFLYIVDRKKDMIITGGFNVFPSEVERAILQLPAVEDCAVVGVPDDKWGEAVLATIQLKPGATLSEDEVIAHCRATVGGVKTPKHAVFVAELPRSGNGKVLRRAIRDPYWAGRSRSV